MTTLDWPPNTEKVQIKCIGFPSSIWDKWLHQNCQNCIHTCKPNWFKRSTSFHKPSCCTKLKTCQLQHLKLVQQQLAIGNQVFLQHPVFATLYSLKCTWCCTTNQRKEIKSCTILQYNPASIISRSSWTSQNQLLPTLAQTMWSMHQIVCSKDHFRSRSSSHSQPETKPAASLAETRTYFIPTLIPVHFCPALIPA